MSEELENQLLSKKDRRELRREEKRSAAASMQKARSLRRVVLWVVAVAAIGGTLAGVIYLAVNSGDSSNGTDSLLTTNLSSSDWVMK